MTHFGVDQTADHPKFADLLWAILGGASAGIALAARHLRMNRKTLWAILDGYTVLTRSQILARKWPERLAQHYPEGWGKYSHLFEVALKDVPVRFGSRLEEPKDGLSFGHALWLVLGGKEARADEAADQLNCTVQQLHHVVQGYQSVSRRWFDKHGWGEQLAGHYPAGWAEHRETLEARTRDLARQRSAAVVLPGMRQGRPREIRAPADSGSFGYAVWAILKDAGVDSREAAECLGVSYARLSQIVHGHQRPTKRFLAKNKWRERLAERCPEPWLRYRKMFETRAALFKQAAGRQARRPSDKNSLGYALWEILGGRSIDFAAAKTFLSVSPGRLSEIVHSKKPLSQRYILKNKWPVLLAQHYPEGWKCYGEMFEARLRKLRERPGAERKAREPKNHDSFGYVLWKVVEGPDIDRLRVAELLGLHEKTVSSFFHGILKPTQAFIAEKCWRQRLAKNYAKTWKLYSSEFERYAAQLKPARQVRKLGSSTGDKFADTLRYILGRDIGDLKKVARLLHIKDNALAEILEGRWKVPAKLVLDKGWPYRLAEAYPERWHYHRDAFNAALLAWPSGMPMASLRKRVSGTTAAAWWKGQTKEPADKNGFGYVLWTILGGENARLVEAAQQLEISPARLSRIIHGKLFISQVTVEAKEWREKLRRYYPAVWEEHKESFEQAVSGLVLQRGNRSRAPDDPDSFGYIVWKILGGENANMKEAAGRLGVVPPALSAIIQNKRSITRMWVVRNKWRERLAHFYPETWKEYGAAFDRVVLGFSARLGAKGKEPGDPESFGYTLWQILGGPEVCVTRMAQELGCGVGFLSGLMHGHHKITAKWIKNHRWRQRLSRRYPENWARHKDEFERRIPKRKGKLFVEPDGPDVKSEGGPGEGAAAE